MDRYAPSPDPLLSIKFYERTPEQQALLGYLVDPSQLGESGGTVIAEEASSASNQVRREPHGSIGAAAGHRAIAQSNSAEIADALFRYSAPEEVRQSNYLMLQIVIVSPSYIYLTFYICLS